MASKNEDNIDFDKLEQELNAAVEADKKYWRENDAKFRAVNQKVASYDEFRDIVQAAHLRPLDKGDKITEERFQQPWNTAATNYKDKTKLENSQITQVASKLPSNGHEFARYWRTCCKTDEEKLKYLKKNGAENLAKIFKAEISMGLLGEILMGLGHFDEEDMETVIEILEALSGTNRFKLSLDFLSSKEKQICSEIFRKIQECMEKGVYNIKKEQLESLCKFYNVM